MHEGGDGGADEERGGGHADDGLTLAGPSCGDRTTQVLQRAVGGFISWTAWCSSRRSASSSEPNSP